MKKKKRRMKKNAKADLDDEVNIPEEQTIYGFRFVLTSWACPEQYNVFDALGKQVGYVRLRHGILRCDYPEWGGEEIYGAVDSEDKMGDGQFISAEVRDAHLKKIALCIKEKIYENSLEEKPANPNGNLLDMQTYRTMLTDFAAGLANILSEHTGFIAALSDISGKREEILKKYDSTNLFSSIFKFRLENFHSEMLRKLLDKTTPDIGNSRYLNLFIQVLRDINPSI